ncbi:Crp/Fnr family transcriptional regulator [Sinomicrobium weinanense]|uniref:Crp/Fnr family transcriptional regulator n=1 Tax=Sinomicrobium weinanense TaxID=2842200 RepID=A0A926JVB8_9FLAO|nr:Crp/Fnr family transcriptional regulator [Sinomicrobium weinanense]MBC9797877.1 Crp/Fnr family transcriptional regulator [Sinomicrobium weinanense]MBU3122751.1 Crp/Fnr family transcriptional regulator [Sinomicrobium weinanense]
MKKDFFQTIYNSPHIGKTDYEEIAKAHSQMDVRSGSLLLEEGKIASEFYIIEKGLFRSFVYDYDGNEVTTEFYGPKELLIESFSLFHRSPSMENFQALSNGTVWKIEYQLFQQLLGKIEGLREWGRTWATSHLFIIKKRSIKMLTMNATDRYLNLLNERPQIIRQVPLKFIASYLGITDTSLSRIRKEIVTT